MAISVNPSKVPLSDTAREAILAEPGFGKYFTDNMVTANWSSTSGWSELSLTAYGPLSLDPATMVLHYGQEVFEGLKAYRQPDGGVAIFRAEQNARRFARSANRLALPELPEELFLESVRALVSEDQKWVPVQADESLYLRPMMIATEVGLGVRPSSKAEYILIASPAGAYFKGGVRPVTVWISTEYVRAAPGGTGEAKCGGNYAASLIAQQAAAAQGCDQVVWLDAVHREYVEEMGGMNLYFVMGSGANARVMTPKLTGTLLAGITRDSILTLAADLGYVVDEISITVDQWRKGVADGEITEVFACGTAAVITPVGTVKGATGEWTHGNGECGPIALQLRETLLGIQGGLIPDVHGWMERVI
ncbi:MAG TPA: branched-chain amino acid aminotransferase [Candidatus Nanopelagicaceae bacterium]|nr:branched-chain amino acid aminotransferase [Candidatus Nanopelagicaceae bacterium]